MVAEFVCIALGRDETVRATAGQDVGEGQGREMLHPGQFPGNLDVDPRKMAVGNIAVPGILWPPVARLEIQMPVDGLVIGADQAADSLALRPVGGIFRPFGRGSVIIVAISFNAPASHSRANLRPTGSEQIEPVFEEPGGKALEGGVPFFFGESLGNRVVVVQGAWGSVRRIRWFPPVPGLLEPSAKLCDAEPETPSGERGHRHAGNQTDPLAKRR